MSKQEFYQQALRCFQQGDFDGAVESCTNGLNAGLNKEQGLLLRGKAYRELGEFQKSSDDLNKAIELYPSSAQLRFERGVLLMRIVEFANTNIDNLQPPGPYWALQAGVFIMTMVEERAKRVNTSSDDLHFDEQSALEDCLKTASDDFNKSIGSNCTNPDYYYWRGKAKQTQGYFHEAIDEFSEAIKLNPNNADYFVSRASAYFDCEESCMTIPDCEQAISLFTKDGCTGPKLAVAYCLCGRANLIRLGSPITCSPQEVERRTTIKNECLSDFSEAIKNDPRNPDCYYFSGWVYWRMGDCRSAITQFSKCIEIDQNYAMAYWMRGSMHVLTGEQQVGDQDIQKAVEIDPSLASLRPNNP
jgi:tetratricopeptide (TPR) repeat protein